MILTRQNKSIALLACAQAAIFTLVFTTSSFFLSPTLSIFLGAVTMGLLRSVVAGYLSLPPILSFRQLVLIFLPAHIITLVTLLIFFKNVFLVHL